MSTQRDLTTLFNLDWSQEPPPRPLHAFGFAPAMPGVYELGYFVNGRFEPLYIGRAVGASLRERLGQHARKSHNPRVRRAACRLWYRTRVLRNTAFAAYVEAVSIAAFDYRFNRRNEWKQHWALES